MKYFNRSAVNLIMKMRYPFYIAMLLAAVVFASCSGSAPADKEKSSKGENRPPALPKVTASGKNLLFSWFEGTKAKTATDITKIPDKNRKEVRVQDLSVPPDKRNPDWIFIADLTKPEKNGTFKVKAIKRDLYEASRHPKTNLKDNRPLKSERQNLQNSKVVLYATTHCPYCHKARRWLLEQKIPFTEKDVEKDREAALHLAMLEKAQGIPSGGVPMIEVNGKLIPGFDPSAVLEALASSSGGGSASSEPPSSSSSAPGQVKPVLPIPAPSADPPAVRAAPSSPAVAPAPGAKSHII
jgi:glutaredoxin